jgi:hypothetical protein
VEENLRPTNAELEKLLMLQGQLRREIELAKQKGIPRLLARRKLAAVSREIAVIKSRETKGDLFDTQLNLF